MKGLKQLSIDLGVYNIMDMHSLSQFPSLFQRFCAGWHFYVFSYSWFQRHTAPSLHLYLFL